MEIVIHTPSSQLLRSQSGGALTGLPTYSKNAFSNKTVRYSRGVEKLV
jgi:hypothetical protein